jgi:hypothetical protein
MRHHAAVDATWYLEAMLNFDSRQPQLLTDLKSLEELPKIECHPEE